MTSPHGVPQDSFGASQHAAGHSAGMAAAGMVALPSPYPASAFEQTMVAMRSSAATSGLDAQSFERKLTRCDVRDCLGQCCTEGTSLGEEEVRVLRELVVLEREFFESHGIFDAENLIQSSGRAGAGGRTLVRDRLIGEVAADYPERFGHAACAFLVEGGRCAFQVLSAERGESPWKFKPIRCWLHPISLNENVVSVADSTSADESRGARSQVTRCSRTHPGGVPARELLHEEIRWLGAILERDLEAELEAFAVARAHIEAPSMTRATLQAPSVARAALDQPPASGAEPAA